AVGIATVALVTVVLVAAVLLIALVLGVADGVATEGADTGTNGGAFQAAAALVANDTADCGTTEGADNGTSLGVGTCGAGGERHGSQECEEDAFHGFGNALVVTGKHLVHRKLVKLSEK